MYEYFPLLDPPSKPKRANDILETVEGSSLAEATFEEDDSDIKPYVNK